MKQIRPTISFIIPVYNVADYVATCIDSVLNSGLTDIEIVIINDGSTDNSGEIAEIYAGRDDRIQVFHQSNCGLPATRNRGIGLAKGAYIAFIDSDDWLIGHSIVEIYRIANQSQADIIMGNLLFYYPDGTTGNPFSPIPSHLPGKIWKGTYCFTELMKHSAYPPMVCNYVYRREWLKSKNLRFESIVHEDELWTPIALCLAERVVVTNIDFYGYRQRNGSIMKTLQKEKRATDLIFIANRLLQFAAGYSFSEKGSEVKSQLFVKIFWLYHLAFLSIGRIRNSRFILPSHHLYCIFQIRNKLSPNARKKCIDYYRIAKQGLKTYLCWRYSCIIGNLSTTSLSTRKVILIYNTMWGKPLQIPISEIPENCMITTDRSYMNTADMVVFHLPDLEKELEEDLEKPDGQKWVAFSLVYEENYSFMKDTGFMELFDYRMSYHQDTDVVYPYYRYELGRDLFQETKVAFSLKKDICILIPSTINRSEPPTYLNELMKYIEIDSYEWSFDGKKQGYYNDWDKNLDLYKQYKFVIAFENACATDYVTELFYEPLQAGSVPVYLGAPNIEDFMPGNNSFVNVRHFQSPISLASYLKKACKDETLYNDFFHWKKQIPNPSFTQKIQAQQINPFVRLFKLLK